MAVWEKTSEKNNDYRIKLEHTYQSVEKSNEVQSLNGIALIQT